MNSGNTMDYQFQASSFESVFQGLSAYNPSISNAPSESFMYPTFDPVNLIKNQFREIGTVKEIYLRADGYEFDVYIVVSGDPKLSVTKIAKAESELLGFLAEISSPASVDVHVAPDEKRAPANDYMKIYPSDPMRECFINDVSTEYAHSIGTSTSR